MDVRRLFRDLLNVESELKTALKTNVSSVEAQAYRQRMLEITEAMIAADVGFAAEKEVEQWVWKPCFYKRIEEFRRLIRKSAAASASDPTLVKQFHRISNEFKGFLEESTQFYERLHAAFRKGFEDAEGHHQYALEIVGKSRQSCHRCLIFLGDLARYRELHNQKAKKDFAKAESYYHKALAVLPQSGNPHNQLAVLATYSDAECIAVYRYCRSLMVAQPFSTSQDNLVLLLEKNRKKATLQSFDDRPLTDKISGKEKAFALKGFLQRIIRAQGVFFAFSAASVRVTKEEDYNAEEQNQLLDLLAMLLKVKGLGDALLLKIIIIAIFSVVRLQDCQKETPNHKPILKAHSLSFLIGMLQRAIRYVAERRDVWSNIPSVFSQKECSEMKTFPAVLRILGPVAVGVDFLGGHVELKQELIALPIYPEFIEALKGLMNVLPDIPPEMLRVSQENASSTKESVELRGFLPLEGINPSYGSNQPVPSQPLSDAKAFTVHVMKLRAFFADFNNCFPSSLEKNNSNSLNVEGEGEDDEVILYKPTVATVLSSSQGLTSPTPFSIPTLQGPQQPPSSFFSDSSLFSGASNTMWSTAPKNAAEKCNESNNTSAFLPTFLQENLDSNPIDQLQAIKKETEQYELADSSLSGLLSMSTEEGARSTTTTIVPPGFGEEIKGGDHIEAAEGMLYTSNPFLVGQRNH